jgi:WD domain, G-beta repeat
MQSLLSIEFLEEPFPTNLALSGALIESSQTGEFMLYNLDEIRNPKLLLEDDRNKINSGNSCRYAAPAAMEVVELRQQPGGSSALPAGIFYTAQRPGTNQLAVTTLSKQAHILRLQRKDERKEYEGEEDEAMDMMDVEEEEEERENGNTMNNGSNHHQSNGNANGNSSNQSLASNGNTSGSSTWELDIEYNLEGHTAGCPAVRVCNDRAVTACFDGGLRVFELPPCTRSGSSPSASGATDSPNTAANKNNNNRSRNITNNNHNRQSTKSLHPVSTFMDDPEHTQQPPLNTEQNRGVCGLALSSSADRIVSGSNDMQIKVWDTATGRITLRLGGCMGWPWWVEGFDPGLNEVTSASTDGYVRVWDLRAGQQSLAMNLNTDPTDSIFPVATVLPRVDGNFLVAGCFDTSIYVMDRRMGRVMKGLRGHTDRLARLALRGDTLLSCAFDGDVGLWEF